MQQSGCGHPVGGGVLPGTSDRKSTRLRRCGSWQESGKVIENRMQWEIKGREGRRRLMRRKKE